METPFDTQPVGPAPAVMIVGAVGVYISGRFFLKELAFYQPYTKQSWCGTFMAPVVLESLQTDIQEDVKRQTNAGVHIHFNDGSYQPLFITHILNFFGSYYHLVGVDDATRDMVLQYTTYPVSSITTIDSIHRTSSQYRSTYCEFHGFDTHKCALNKAIHTGTDFVSMHALRRV